MSFGSSSAAGATAGISSELSTMIPTMMAAANAQIEMSMLDSVLNVAKTGASDTEDMSKKG
ncbi:hypothetical protein WM40_15595 [Robbsia andropogonis]|uniref:Motility protein n=1 Tax=Robbsia andropogonis TaxID=28092 RepID=A0A0F5JYN8_9BURK|nr:hypothetical protein [Robbsia andropogonis]KKB62719.1 hypothetical protein WM40_15595 [Robbsia andropogonis]MCP1119718.1 hypothetical protein [Robbsia andropogonis]MCP1129701.1 hypothetical protein [Robbsia andropogonis]